MTTYPLSVEVPVPVFDELAKRATQSHRTVAEEVVYVLVTTVPTENEMPAYLKEKLNVLEQLDDSELWVTAQSRLPNESSEKLEELSYKRQAEGLAEEETELQMALVRDFELNMLARVQGAFLLKQRGHDISLLTSRS